MLFFPVTLPQLLTRKAHSERMVQGPHCASETNLHLTQSGQSPPQAQQKHSAIKKLKKKSKRFCQDSRDGSTELPPHSSYTGAPHQWYFLHREQQVAWTEATEEMSPSLVTGLPGSLTIYSASEPLHPHCCCSYNFSYISIVFTNKLTQMMATKHN